MRDRFHSMRVVWAVWVLFAAASLVWVPSAAADAILVDATAFLSASPDHGDSDEIEQPFEDFFSDSVSATWSESGTESAFASQGTTISGVGGVLTQISTQANAQSSASGGPEDRACCASSDSILELEFSIDAPTTLFVSGVIGANHSGRNCSSVSLAVDGSGAQPFVANEGSQCDTDEPSELVLDESIDLDIAGSYLIDLRARSVSSVNDDVPSSDGSASWNLTLGFCSNEFTDGADDISGTPGNDVLCGGAGNDSIDGGGGDDTIIGGDGSDSITGGEGADKIDGGEEQDFIQGGPGTDNIVAGAGDDGDEDSPISGGPGSDNLFGGRGTDTMDGDLGDDIMEGGDDNDLDLLRGCNFDDPLCNADQADLDAAGVTDVDLIDAGPGGSVITAGSGDDILDGGSGFDDISGGFGSDVVDAAGGRDAVSGGPGNDELLGGGGHESGTKSGATLGVFGGAGNDIVEGNAGDDLLEGGAGRDEMLGNAGSDKLRGEGDNDCLIGGTRKDVFVGGPNNDKLLARDNVRDVVHGNGGTDRARIDEDKDDVDGVENDNFQGSC